jgi:antitoxin HigA-1
MALIMHPSLAVHPGDWLKSEIVDPHGVSINRLATSFHVTRQTLSNLFNGHTALSADMAIRFEKAFGIRADTLMRMQANYDMAQARSCADDQTTTHSNRTKRPVID